VIIFIVAIILVQKGMDYSQDLFQEERINTEKSIPINQEEQVNQEEQAPTDEQQQQIEMPSNEVNEDLDKYGGIVINRNGEHGLVMATRDFDRLMNYSDAVEACNNCEEKGFTDWYLPEYDELEIVYKDRDLRYKCDLKEVEYWTSTLYTGGVRLLNFRNGEDFMVPYSKLYDDYARVIPVRKF